MPYDPFEGQPLATDEIFNERVRQISEEGHAPIDDVGRELELAIAADCYLQAAWVQLHPQNSAQTPAEIAEAMRLKTPPFWVWDLKDWKPDPDPRKNLLKAAALIAAALDAQTLAAHPADATAGKIEAASIQTATIASTDEMRKG